MPTSLIDADSLLAIDVGGVNTRAMLFDVVDGRYRFMAMGSAPSTANAPYHDVSEGIRAALDRLQTVAGRTLVGPDERLIVPSTVDGAGVDSLVATLSAGPPLQVVAVGLLEDVSLESACRLATTTYAKVIERISLNDRRKPEARLDTILRLRPNLILAAGGTEGGASQSVIRLLESVGLACYLLPENQRPEVLFTGNQALQDEIKATLGKITPLRFAPNLRPSLEVEQLEAAQSCLAGIFRTVRGHQIPGVDELNTWVGGGLLPSATAFGRVIRYLRALSKESDPNRGVFGIDVGASATTVAASFSEEVNLGVYPYLGLGEGLTEFLEYTRVEEIIRWLPMVVTEAQVREYIYTKALYPASIPVTTEDLAFEQALARQAMRVAVRNISPSFPSRIKHYGEELLPWFEPIIASGSVLTRAPSLAQSLLMLLDGLQPTGITTIWLDQNHLMPALGAAAAVNPLLAVQVIDSSTFLNLGTVITPVSNVRPGTPVLRLTMTTEGGAESSLEVRQGSLDMLPLPFGQSARLQVTPLHGADVGMGRPGRGGGVRVVGGALGLVVDARGRPLRLANDPERRAEAFKKWLWTFGA
jgi:hypothetical protein